MEHDVIYLQHGESPIRLEEVGITWCQDEINAGDTKYLLATPEREAAPELLEALEDILNVPREGQKRTYAAQVQMIMVIAGAAIARAIPPDEDGNKE